MSEVTIPTPNSRKEQYLYRMATSNTDQPYPDAPISRIEQYLAYIAENGGGGTDANAVHYTADANKTAEQKQQARDNIGVTELLQAKVNKPTSETYTIATADWSALASSAPFTYSATVTATHTIGNDTVCELVNDNAVLFGTHGFAIGAVSGQSVTIYSIGQPSASVTIEVDYYG